MTSCATCSDPHDRDIQQQIADLWADVLGLQHRIDRLERATGIPKPQCFRPGPTPEWKEDGK